MPDEVFSASPSIQETRSQHESRDSGGSGVSFSLWSDRFQRARLVTLPYLLLAYINYSYHSLLRPCWAIARQLDSVSGTPVLSQSFLTVSTFFDVCFQIAAPHVSQSSSISFPAGFQVKACRVMPSTGLQSYFTEQFVISRLTERRK